MLQKYHSLSIFHKQLIYHTQYLLPCFPIQDLLLSVIIPYECWLSPPKNSRLQWFSLSIVSFLSRILDLHLKLINFTMIVLFLLFVPSFLRIFPVLCALSTELFSSSPKFSFTKSVMMLSLSSHISFSKQRLFWRLRSSKLASFFFVFVFVCASFTSATLLSMSSSFLLTLSTFSLWYWTLSNLSIFLDFWTFFL